jgi:hypothetical protein
MCGSTLAWTDCNRVQYIIAGKTLFARIWSLFSMAARGNVISYGAEALLSHAQLCLPRQSKGKYFWAFMYGSGLDGFAE